MMHRLLREPLTHFVLIGALLFMGYAWLNPDVDRRSREAKPEIHITEGDVNWLVQTWSRQWRRQPTAEELNGLVADLVREQLLAREAQELGLAENDTIIRRRLAQKVEFLVRDAALLAEPTDEDLQAFHARHVDRYWDEGRVSFVHAFFSTEKRADAAGDSRAVLATLIPATGGAEELGDRSLMETDFADVDARTVAGIFGPEFAEDLMKVDPGQWTGPIESAYGMHLVCVSSLQPRRQLTFEEVRQRVRIDWQAEQQSRADRAYFEALLRKYEVVIDKEVGDPARPIELVKGPSI